MSHSSVTGPGAISLSGARRWRRARAAAFVLTFASVGVAGCGSSSTPANYDSGVGGPVTGALDNHCTGVDPVVVLMDSCTPSADAGTLHVDAAVPDDGGSPSPYGPTLFNAEGDDDDCKYHVKFMMTAAKNGQNANLQVTVTHLADGTPAVGADVTLEGSSSDIHFLPNNATKTTETPAASGVYTIAPVKFDTPGRWQLRFHLYERCSDALESSPHGHVAFFVDVAP